MCELVYSWTEASRHLSISVYMRLRVIVLANTLWRRLATIVSLVHFSRMGISARVEMGMTYLIAIETARKSATGCDRPLNRPHVGGIQTSKDKFSNCAVQLNLHALRARR